MKRILLILCIMELSFVYSKLETIDLVEPEKTGGMPVYEALSKRKSGRNFNDEKDLSNQELSTMLWSCYGPNRENGMKTSASALGIYPYDIFVFLKDGVYNYNSEENKLIPYIEGDYREQTGLEAWVGRASANICLVGEPSKEYVTEYIELDLGFCLQNMYLYCANDEIKCCARNEMNRNFLMTLLNLEESKYIYLCFSAGY